MSATGFQRRRRKVAARKLLEAKVRDLTIQGLKEFIREKGLSLSPSKYPTKDLLADAVLVEVRRGGAD